MIILYFPFIYCDTDLNKTIVTSFKAYFYFTCNCNLEFFMLHIFTFGFTNFNSNLVSNNKFQTYTIP